MTDQDFIKKIEHARKKVDLQYYICNALDSSFHCNDFLMRDFIKYCKPEYNFVGCVWFGYHSQANVPKRIEVLKQFKNIVLEKKLYERY